MTINNVHKKNKGFTLIELMLYMSLFVVIFTALFASLNIFYSNKIKNRTILEVEQQGQLISILISQEIRNAQSILSPLIGSSSDVLSLEHLDVSKNPISFSLLNGKMIVSEDSNIFNLSNSKIEISNLNFENNSIASGTQSIFFSFDVSYESSSDRREYKYDQNFSGTANLLKK